MAKAVRCICGYTMQADTDDELWAKALEHIQTDHPDLVGQVVREEFLAQAEIV